MCVWCTTPQLILPMIITPVDKDVALTWTDDPANTGGYRVWWSADPYFVPGATDSTFVSAPASPYTDTGAIGTTKYYIILGVDETGQTVSAADRVGVFSLSLTPGAIPSRTSHNSITP